MANLLAYTDFTGDCQLSISELRLTEFNAFLTVQQERFLRSILGTKLYASFITGWAETTPNSKWTDLINGCDYDYNDETYHFYGLKEALKYFSYSRWLNQQPSLNTPVGNVKIKNENSVNVFPNESIINANNICFNLVVEADLFITEKGETVYADYLFTNPVVRVNIFGI